MKTMKRVVALFLCIFMLASVPVVAIAETGDGSNGETVACSYCGSENGHVMGCFATFTEVNKTAAFSSYPVTLYFNPGTDPDNSASFTEEDFGENFTFTVQYSFPGENGVVWYMLDTENWSIFEGTTEPYSYIQSSYVKLNEEADGPAATVDGHTIRVSGSLPDNASLQADTLTDEMTSYIHSDLLGLKALSGDDICLAYDISLLVGESKVQPDGTVTVKLDGLDTTKYTEFTVYHLPNIDIDTIQRIIDGEDLAIDYPEVIDPTVGDGYIEFQTDGFSIYYIVSGSESHEIGTDTYYILPGAEIILTEVTSDSYEVTYPTGQNDETCGVIITYNSSSDTLMFASSSVAVLGTYVIEWAYRTVTVHIVTPQYIFTSTDVQNVYFTCLTDSTEIPNEPMSGESYSWRYIKPGTNGQYSFGGYFHGAYSDTPEGFIDLEAVGNTAALKQSVKEQNVVGVVDSGWGNDTLPCITMSEDEWHELLMQFVQKNTVYISNGSDGRTRLSVDMVSETLPDGSYRYQMYPYVIKLILEDGEWQPGWHVDCAIVDTKTYSVSYEYNLPSTAIIHENSDLLKPETKFYTPGTAGVEVGVMTLGNSEVTGDTSVTIYDTNTLSTSEYKFLCWNTEPDGSGTSYNPNDTLPAITENVVLYAIWNHTQTSGSLKLQKTEIFEDVNDERKDDGASYTFTVTFTNAEAGKSYPYTIYNSDNTAKSADNSLVSGGTIVLKAGEYAVVNNVPGGAVTVTESVAGNSEFEISWQVAGSSTAGNTVTATIAAGKQTEIICVNTYSPLVADLTIIKTGWNSTDENQSFIFDVAGPNNFKITVAINGKGKVTIKDLPIGEYTVTEQTKWSWRYIPTGDNGKKITLVTNDENTVTFENERSLIYWLSGDSFCTNWWGGENGTVTNRKASN